MNVFQQRMSVMKINSIEISNMFSYYGRNKIDFDLSDDSKNINIIYGRNGNGKTSFINSIKLLFLGTQNPLYSKQLRKSVSENGTIALLDYVVGNKNWYGILNKKAKSEAENSFFISIDFFENNKFQQAKVLHLVIKQTLGNFLLVLKMVFPPDWFQPF